jgi:hypothetical protein
MRFDSRDLTVKLWAATSEACCGCSDTQDQDKCHGCTDTRQDCQEDSGHQYAEAHGSALTLLRQQLQQTLASDVR